MKKTDRKGSTDKYETVSPPTMGVSVVVEGRGIGTVCDWPTFAVSTVKLATGEIVKVPHGVVTKLDS